MEDIYQKENNLELRFLECNRSKMNLRNEKSFYFKMRNIVKNKVNTINALASDIYYGIYFY